MPCGDVILYERVALEMLQMYVLAWLSNLHSIIQTMEYQHLGR